MFPSDDFISFIIFQNDTGFHAELTSFFYVDNSVDCVEKLSEFLRNSQNNDTVVKRCVVIYRVIFCIRNFVTDEIVRNNSKRVSHFMVTTLFSIYRVNIKKYPSKSPFEGHTFLTVVRGIYRSGSAFFLPSSFCRNLSIDPVRGRPAGAAHLSHFKNFTLYGSSFVPPPKSKSLPVIRSTALPQPASK